MLGAPFKSPVAFASLASSLPANGKRQDFIRATIANRDGELVVTPFRLQDSSTQKIFAQSDALIVRRPDAPPAAAGEPVEVLLLDQ
jgi:molybdopterin molybdotransferase